MIKNLNFIKFNSVDPVNLIINKINGYIEESNDENKYLTLVHTDESKDTLKKYEGLRKRMRDFIRSLTNKSGIYVDKYIKIKFNPDNDIPQKKNSRTS